jgi:hypothetical protein
MFQIQRFTTQAIPVIERRRIEPPQSSPRPPYVGELGDQSRHLYHGKKL